VTWLPAAVAFPLASQGSAPPWWQTVGGLLVGFGLLFLCLRLLARFQRRGATGQASLLAVWPLGPRREVQVLRLGDEVHYVYRHDGAMVLLRQESLADWEAGRSAEAHGGRRPEAPRGLRALLRTAGLPAGPR
jgi:hypothetical protein